MKHNLVKAAAVAALTAGALFAAPVAANAQSYTPPATGQVSSSTVAPGGTVTFSVASGVFAAGESVSFSITGENASAASLGMVKFAVETKALGAVTANSAGGLGGVSVKLPANATGKYTILATSASNPVGVSATVTAAAAGAGGTDDSGKLPATGANSEALLALWIGGGALVLAGGGVTVASAVRRNRKVSATV